MNAPSRHLFAWTLATALGAGLFSPASASADPKRIARGDVPDAVRATLNRHTRNAYDVVFHPLSQSRKRLIVDPNAATCITAESLALWNHEGQ